MRRRRAFAGVEIEIIGSALLRNARPAFAARRAAASPQPHWLTIDLPASGLLALPLARYPPRACRAQAAAMACASCCGVWPAPVAIAWRRGMPRSQVSCRLAS